MTEEELDRWLNKWAASGLAIDNFLALANANGLSFPKTLELHRWMLAEKGQQYVTTWSSAATPEEYETLRDGGYFAISYIKNADWENPYLA